MRNGFSCRQPILGELNDKATDVTARSFIRCLFYNITKIVRRHAQFIGTILYGWLTESQLKFILEIITEQAIEADKDIRILNFSGDKLTVYAT